MAKSDFLQKKQHTAAIWFAVLILLFILLLTLFWLAPLLWHVSDSGSTVIPLFYDGDRQIVNKGTLQYISAEETPGLITYDENVQWENQTEVDLFKTEYSGWNGLITVQSDNGEKVIAPGTSSEYHFTLKNTGNISLDYFLELSSSFSYQDRDLPIRIRLSSGDQWIIGSEDIWAVPDELESKIGNSTLDVGYSTDYTFEWLWPFEVGTDDERWLNDLNDVILANAAVDQDVSFQLTIKTVATVTPGAIPRDNNGSVIVVPLIRWNVFTHGIIPGFGLGLLLILLWRTPVYVTGFAVCEPGAEFKFDKKKDIIRPDGRFVFKKVYTGKHTLAIPQSEKEIKLKRSRKVEGILFEEKDDILIIKTHPSAIALELYLVKEADGIVLQQDKWAMIDRKHRVFTPAGMIEPVDKCNHTPDGLTVDAKGNLDVETVSENS